MELFFVFSHSSKSVPKFYTNLDSFPDFCMLLSCYAGSVKFWYLRLIKNYISERNMI